ncbi:SDR family NAD(P)-dependent oxidoreductase (plasmid) [Sphingomonas paeninsulae]|uniref:SDR family NAD(P)-dependent oxidoreductase n=1 Tax=Sphingomonas paeninsulae TaxID=2319844 RepID=A0A494TI78_SPHPE|nr:SDR family NAD(P)-dependent oxidoreductase [Sphingomonas paeninsulae]
MGADRGRGWRRIADQARRAGRMTLFSGNTALITGAASGIGRGAAHAFARRGARLILADIDEAGVAATAASIVDLGGRRSPLPSMSGATMPSTMCWILFTVGSATSIF